MRSNALHNILLAVGGLALALLGGLSLPSAALAQTCELMSQSSAGVLGNANSGARNLLEYERTAVSGDGRHVAFNSLASNLVSGDTNGAFDVFVRDRLTGITTRVSVSSSGGEADQESWNPSISRDGRYVVFASNATNLITGDVNAKSDVFLHDRVTGSTLRVSQTPAGAGGNGDSVSAAISGDGRYVAFQSHATNLTSDVDVNVTMADVFVYEVATGVIVRASVNTAGVAADHQATYPSISHDGRYVSFNSYSSNLSPLVPDTSVDHIYRRDLVAGVTDLVSQSTGGVAGNAISRYSSISGDGQYVAYQSEADNLVTGDTNGLRDIFVRDFVWDQTYRASTDASGNQGTGGGAFPACQRPAISADSLLVTFYSSFTNLVPGDTNGTWDVFVKNIFTDAIERVNLAPGGGQANGGAGGLGISAGGAHVGFQSNATNLVAGDTNGFWDTFATSPVMDDPALATALDTTGLWFVTSSWAPWFVQSTYTQVGASAAQSNQISENETTWIETQVQGPGVLSFWWRVSCRDRQDFLKLYVDDLEQNYLTGDSGWQSQVLALGAGWRTIRWTYQRGAGSPANLDFAWLDGVAWSPLRRAYWYRAYNPTQTYHFFTKSRAEFLNAVNNGGYQDESTNNPYLFQVLAEPGPGAAQVFRLYNAYSGRHYYTFFTQERDVLVSLGWNYEHGEGYLYRTATPNTYEIYKLYHTVVGVHLYTANASEVRYVLANIPGWEQHSSLGWGYVPGYANPRSGQPGPAQAARELVNHMR
ncbi:MAG: hypothetical protein KQJ78_26015 [Deltaproteobacteria bacterium]|nr:hypothetical protein [Deltaproteobacteria bacterium]